MTFLNENGDCDSKETTSSTTLILKFDSEMYHYDDIGNLVVDNYSGLNISSAINMPCSTAISSWRRKNNP